MKIVHSWLHTDSQHNQDKFFYQMTLLSILSAKKSFGNIHLYTNEEGKKHFEKFNFPYDSVSTELENLDIGPGGFAMGKLKTYSLQETPFIHIDHDTFLFESKYLPASYRFYFGFPDLQTPFTMNTWLSAEKAYFKTFNEFKDLFDDSFYLETNFDIIPNASIFGGHDVDTIKKVCNVILEIYLDNKERFDKNHYSSCLLEQFLFFPMAELLFDDIQCNKRWIDDNSYIWTQHVPLQMGKEVKIHGQKLFDIKPLKQYKKHNGKEHMTMYDDNKLRILIDNWFGGYLHLGHLRDDYVMKWVMLEKLKKYYDAENYLKKIDEVFPEKELWETNIFSTLL